jgi:hypothetical protein
VYLYDREENRLWQERIVEMVALAGGLKNKDKSPIVPPNPDEGIQHWIDRLHSPLDIEKIRAAALRLVQEA